MPDGVRTLNDALHNLHAQAGRPSLSTMASWVGSGVAGRSRIHEAFVSARVPDWGLLDVLVEQLARNVPAGPNPDEEVRRFHGLWLAAIGLPASDDAPAGPTSDGSARNPILDEAPEEGLIGLVDRFYRMARTIKSEKLSRATHDVNDLQLAILEQLPALQHALDNDTLMEHGPVIAQRLENISLRLKASGAELAEEISSADMAFRYIIREIAAIDLPKTREMLDRIDSKIQGLFTPDDEDTLSFVMSYVKVLQQTGPSMRRTLDPAYVGLVAIGDANRLMKTWKDLTTEARSQA